MEEQSCSAEDLAATRAGITAAMTPDGMTPETPKGFVIQIGSGKISATPPADKVLSGSDVLAGGDLRVTALKQSFGESFD